MRLRILSLIAFFVLTGIILPAQDLMDLLEEDEPPRIDYTSATYKTTRIVIGQSIETPPKGNMLFLVTHHFGKINSGYENLFGLNQAFSSALGSNTGSPTGWGSGLG